MWSYKLQSVVIHKENKFLFGSKSGQKYFSQDQNVSAPPKKILPLGHNRQEEGHVIIL